MKNNAIFSFWNLFFITLFGILLGFGNRYDDNWISVFVHLSFLALCFFIFMNFFNSWVTFIKLKESKNIRQWYFFILPLMLFFKKGLLNIKFEKNLKFWVEGILFSSSLFLSSVFTQVFILSSFVSGLNNLSPDSDWGAFKAQVSLASSIISPFFIILSLILLIVFTAKSYSKTSDKNIKEKIEAVVVPFIYFPLNNYNYIA